MITLDIFHHNDQTTTLKDVGIDYSLTECDLRPVTFYTINAISTYEENGRKHASIHTNGREFIASISYEELWEKLNKLKKDEGSTRNGILAY